MTDSDFVRALAEILTPIVQESINQAITQTKKEVQMPEHLTPKEAAELLRIKASSLAVMKCRGDIPKDLYYQRGNRTYYKRAEVVAYIEGKYKQ